MDVYAIKMNSFTLHERVAADTHAVCDLALCRVLLMNDKRFPWLVLVPMRPDLREIIDLPPGDRAVLMEEIARTSSALNDLFAPDKLNVAALGNKVPQLHVHVIARKKTDAAWPNPVWGPGTAEPYDKAETGALLDKLGIQFGLKGN